jgi:hypothetical protein
LSRRGLFALLGLAIATLGIVTALRIGTLFPSTAAAATSSPGPVATVPEPTVEVTPTPTPTEAPTEPPPTPEPTAVTVLAPLTGLPVSPEAAQRLPIAVMVDDHVDARPQSGFNAASIVWQAPAEWGIPRYMLVFQDKIPAAVGPIRSAREYYVEWAAEYGAMYVHHGGSPQALTTLRNRGSGEWVWNADGFRWIGRYMWRSASRFAPHNVYTDGEHLRDLAERLGADDGPLKSAWSFGTPAEPGARPIGGSIKVTYPYESITYRYDASTNRYERFINGARKPQVDTADGKVVAPTNVVILRMAFAPLSYGANNHGRLEADNVGTGVAWISTNGRTVKGTWSKKSKTAPTLLFGRDGEPFVLTPGQTFMQVLPIGYGLTIVDGKAPA